MGSFGTLNCNLLRLNYRFAAPFQTSQTLTLSSRRHACKATFSALGGRVESTAARLNVSAMTGEESLGAWQEVGTEIEQKDLLPRSGHSAVALPLQHTHDVLIFGGYTEDSGWHREATNEAWMFSIQQEKQGWTKVQFTGVKMPRARLVAQVAVVGNDMYLIGGWDPGHKQDGGEILGDVWKLDLETYEWTEVKPQGEVLQPISRHQAAAVGSHIYIHTHRNTTDILLLETEVDPPLLRKVPISGPEGSPTSRGLHSMTAVENSLYIYAGAPKEGGMLGDLWRLNLADRRWAELDPEGQTPHVRCSHGAAAVDQTIVFFGGSHYREAGGLQPLNDVFAYDSTKQSWLWPSQQLRGGPSPRNAHSVTALRDGRLLVYGGWDPFKQTYRDTFVLDPAKVEWRGHDSDNAW